MSDVYRTHVQDHGRVVIPAALRTALGIKPGDEVIVRANEREVVIAPLGNAIAQFQDLVCSHVSSDVSLVDELMADRQAEATRE
jgi:AbrB family looped-hinge helix DNA binding protein